MENTMPAVPVDEKEIRGVNFRILLAVITATIAICSTVMVKSSSIENRIYEVDQKIEKAELRKAGDDKVNDLKIKQIELSIQGLQVQMKEIETRLNNQ